MLKRSRVRRPLGFRLATGAAIVGIHALAYAALAHVRAEAPEAPEAVPVEVAFIEERMAEPPAPKASLEVVQVAAPSLPSVELPVDLPPAPVPVTAITVVATTTAPPAPSVSEQPVEVSSIEYVRAPQPRYPPLAKRANAQGVVYLRVLVDTDGHPREVKVHKSSGHELLDRAARDAVQGYLFKPYRQNGVARHALAIVPVEFSLAIRTASR